MKVTIELDQKAMSKSRKFVYFTNTDNNWSTELLTEPQAKTVFKSLKQLSINLENNTGLTF